MALQKTNACSSPYVPLSNFFEHDAMRVSNNYNIRGLQRRVDGTFGHYQPTASANVHSKFAAVMTTLEKIITAREEQDA